MILLLFVCVLWLELCCIVLYIPDNMNFFFSFDWKAVSSIVVKVSSFSALLDLNV